MNSRTARVVLLLWDCMDDCPKCGDLHDRDEADDCPVSTVLIEAHAALEDEDD